MMRPECAQSLLRTGTKAPYPRSSRRARPGGRVLLLALFVLTLSHSAVAQDFFTTFGERAMTAPDPVELGFVETSNGNLHLEIPLGSYAQRGSSEPVAYKLMYDSNGSWVNTPEYSSNVWLPSQVLALYDSGWRLVAYSNSSSYGSLMNYTNGGTTECYWTYNNFNYTSPDGTIRYFPIVTDWPIGGCGSNVATGDAFASDSSGYHMYVTNYTNATVYAPDGTLVYQTLKTKDPAGNSIYVEDRNGNYFSMSTAGELDTLGRLVNPTGTGAYNFINSQYPASPQGASAFTMNWGTALPVHTQFQQSGVTEYIGTVAEPASVTLPNGQTYTFKYDCDPTGGNASCGSPAGLTGYYGLLTSITLPTGGQITYTYTNFKDSYGNENRWLSSRTSAGGTWSYVPQVLTTCTVHQVGCQEEVTELKPNGDSVVYTLTLNNGAWPVSTSYYGHGTLMTTVSDTWDTSNTCPLYQCYGAAYIRKLSEVVTVPLGSTNLTRQTQFTYDSPQTGNITGAKEWGYYPNSAFPSVPDRATYYAYHTVIGHNIVNRPNSMTVCNNVGSSSYCTGGGSIVSQVLNTYDSYTGGLGSVTGSSNHDDVNFGTGVTARGNLTQVQRWVSGSSYLTTTYSYNMLGEVTQEQDPKGNIVKYGYTDAFYSDALPAATYSPAKPTNAFVTSVTLPQIGSTAYVFNYGYYYGTGKTAFSKDLNGQATNYHYIDSLDRPTETIYPIEWDLTNYTSATQTDTYRGVGDSTASSGCTSCLHYEFLYDPWARRISRKLENNPDGPVSVDTAYDVNGRVESQSHPYINASDPNYVFETYTYDGMDRQIQVNHPDNQYGLNAVGNAVTSAGGLTTQQSSTSVYGYGYPFVTVDESGKQNEKWLDGFGRIIEVDEPSSQAGNQSGPTAGSGTSTVSGTDGYSGAIGATPGSAAANVIGTEEVYNDCCQPSCNVYCNFYDSGTVTAVVNGYTAQVTYGNSSTGTTIATALASALSVSSSPVTATASGTTITVTSKATGTTSNYSISLSTATTSSYFINNDIGSSFGLVGYCSNKLTAFCSTLVGGNSAQSATYDNGTVWVTVNNFKVSTSYVQASTPSTLATALASAFNTTPGSPVTATVANGTLTLTAAQTGLNTNYSLSSGSSTSLPTRFSSASFSAIASGQVLTGGSDALPGALSNPKFTAYTYDALDDLTLVSEGAQTRSYTYDGVSRLTYEHTPEVGAVTLAYAVSGTPCSGEPSNPCTKTDARGVVTTYAYDTHNRFVGKSYSIPAGVTAMPNVCTPVEGTTLQQNVCFNYDQGGSAAFALGALTQMVDPSGSESYTYDKQGRVTQVQKVIGSNTYSMSYNLNVIGEVTQLKYPSGRVVQSTYDNVGRLCGIAATTSACGSYTSPYASGYTYYSPANGSYYAAGNPTGFSYGNGVAANFVYSPQRMELTGLSYSQGAQALFSLNYWYSQNSNSCPSGTVGNNGQIQCISDNVTSTRSVSYTYDPLLRLATAQTSQWGLSWTYDRYGNRWSQALTAGSGPTSSLSFGSGGMDSSTTNQPNGYTFDASGNLLVEPISPTYNYTFDGENRMSCYQSGAGGECYTYDGNGTRIQKSVQGGVTTVYVFTAGLDVAEYDNGALPSSPSREFVYDGSRLIATLSGSTTTYDHQDRLSIRLTSDGTTGSPTFGQKLGEQGHYPYGELWYASGTTTNRIFTSYERDNGSTEDGLDYAMARFYNSRVGSFCSADPIEGRPGDPQSWNRYAYAHDEPIDMIDPSGRSFFSFIVDFFEFIFGALTENPEMIAISLGMEGAASGGFQYLKEQNPFEGWEYQPPAMNFAAQQPSQRGPVYCDPGVLDAMAAAMGKYEKNPNRLDKNGKTISNEEGFPVYNSTNGGYKVGNGDPSKPGYNIPDQVQTGPATGWSIDKTANYSVTFHTHPDGTGGMPSTPSTTEGGGPGDSASAAASGKDIYVISNQGVSVAPGTGDRNGKDDVWIIQGKNAADWLAKLRKQCGLK